MRWLDVGGREEIPCIVNFHFSQSLFLTLFVCLFVFCSVFEGPGFKGNLDVPSICWYFIYCEGIQRLPVNTTVQSQDNYLQNSHFVLQMCHISGYTRLIKVIQTGKYSEFEGPLNCDKNMINEGELYVPSTFCLKDD